VIETIVKLGGSLEATGHAPALVTALERLAGEGHSLMLVPGGGRFADEVRAATDASDAPDHAHWAAIQAMDAMAGTLMQCAGSAVLVIGAAAAQAALSARRLPILAPADWLRAADPLPHSWDVTSDSIAAWVAGQVGARRLILLKSVELEGRSGAPGAPGLPVGAAELEALARAGIVDPHLPRALEPGTECWLLNGREPALLRALPAPVQPARPAR
jgi:aspartokinase-like uncharacterized kinase